MCNVNYLNEYKNSEFYRKYQDTYYSNKILKEVFNIEDIKIPKLRGLDTYQKIYDKNIEVMKDVLTLYYNECENQNEDLIWLILCSIYIDPDSKAIKNDNGVECTADGLLSKKRIFDKYGFTLKMIEEYEQYRKVPIFYFPKETNGINQTRARRFGDRIDYTLYDIKMYYENPEECKMKFAYSLPKTSKWLEKIGSFENLIDNYLKVKGIFTDNNYQVYDLETDDKIIEGYKDKYPYEWSSVYYNNIKNKIDEFMKKQ